MNTKILEDGSSQMCSSCSSIWTSFSVPSKSFPEESHGDERLCEWVELVPNICPDWRGLDTAAGIMWWINAGLYQPVSFTIFHVCVVNVHLNWVHTSLRPTHRKTGRKFLQAWFLYPVTKYLIDTWILKVFISYTMHGGQGQDFYCQRKRVTWGHLWINALISKTFLPQTDSEQKSSEQMIVIEDDVREKTQE